MPDIDLDKIYRLMECYPSEKESQYVINVVSKNASSVWENYAIKTFDQFTKLERILKRLKKLNDIHE